MPYRADGRITLQQLRALTYSANGYTARQIAAKMDLTPSAAHQLIHAVQRSLGCESRTHAVAVAIAKGLILASDIELPALPIVSPRRIRVADHYIRRGEVYRSMRPDRPTRRVKIVEVHGLPIVAVTIVDCDTWENERRVQAEYFHKDAVTIHGKPRKFGYLLEGK
jgi:DNA-binding CsgD family transcriptional regulator